MNEPKKIKLENGYQLFNRVHIRSTLDHLHPKLFPDGGPHHNKTIQITGGPSTGKSTLALELIIRCILPQQWHGKCLGKGSSAIFINTDHHVSVIQIIKCVECLLKTLDVPVEEHQKLVEGALKKLTILNCYSSEQLQMTVHNLEYILSENFDIALLAIDSLSCYYWYERYSSASDTFSVNNNCVSLIKQLKLVIDDRKIVTVFTKYETEKGLNSFVDYTITLSRPNILTFFDHEVNKQFTKEYCIDTMFIFKE